MAGNLTPDTNIALLQAAQNNTTHATKALKQAADAKELKKIEGAAQDFEAVFIAEMMKPMFEGTSLEEPFGGGKGEEVFHGMLLQEYGKIVSQTGGVGLADSVKDQMIQMQKQADEGTTNNE